MAANTNVDKRMFEHEDSKFWEVWCDNVTVFTRFGKVGSKGQTRLKKEPNVDAAQKLLEKMVREKAVEGYVQKGGKAVVDSSIKPLDPKDLKKQLASLKDEASHLVFADWLQSHDHPWGELITLQHGISTAKNDKKREQLEKATAKLLKERGMSILGPVAQNKASSFTWNLALLKRAAIGTSVDAKEMLKEVKGFLAQPIASKLEGLSVSPVPTTFETVRDWDSSDRNMVDPWGDALAAIAALVPDSITHVGLGGWPATAAMAYVRMPSFTKVSKAFPKVKSLELTGTGPESPGKFSLSQVTELSVRFAHASSAHLAAISSSKLPKLERLNVWLGALSNCILDDVIEPAEWDEDDEDADRYPPTFKGSDLEDLSVYDMSSYISENDINTFLNSLASTVKHLGLQGATMKTDAFEALINHKAMKQLKTLDLAGGSLGEEQSKSLIKAKKNLAHLESIDLTNNRLGDAAKKVSAALPNAKVDKQREGSNNPGFLMRYTAVME